MSDASGNKVRSLRELPRDIQPSRDLWQGIEARLQAQAPARQPVAQSAWARSRKWQALAAAAVIAALAVGVWIGRTGLPGRSQGPLTASNPTNSAGRSPYIMGARYNNDRALLMKDLQAKLAALPPDTRAKVTASLQTIHDSMRDLEAALGRDPSNALLQELLVNTYQDEMQVLTAVNQAGNSAEGI